MAPAAAPAPDNDLVFAETPPIFECTCNQSPGLSWSTASRRQFFVSGILHYNSYFAMTSPTETTSAVYLDVYLIGAKEKSPSVQMRLATNIAGRFRLSAASVAEGLEGVPCRVGTRLSRREAQALLELLDGLGAVARSVPTEGSGGGDQSASMPVGQAPRHVSAPSAATPSAATPRHRDPAMPPELVSPPSVRDGRITLNSAAVRPAAVVDVSEPIDFAEPGPEGQTGVRGSDTIRCPIHGLIYNRRKASGCVRCLAAARAQARKLTADNQVPFAAGATTGFSSLRHDPIRRAFWGLAVTLLLGFLPAAYYARSINRREVDVLRAEQSTLSASPATRDSLARFDALDAAVDQTRSRGAGRTLLIWLAVSGVSALVWVRATRPTTSY
jgi:hypothetical protein